MILFALLTFCAVGFLNFVYVYVQALLAHRYGIGVKRVSVGFEIFDKYLLSWRGRHWDWRIGWLPIGGYTTFKLANEQLNEDDFSAPQSQSPDETAADVRSGQRCFEAASTPLKLGLALIAPLTQLCLAIVLLSIPVWQGASQLQFEPTIQTNQLAASALPGLRVGEQTASWSGQMELVSNIGVQAFKRYVLFQPLSGWGGYCGWMVTGGSAGAVSLSHWLTFVGMIAALYSLFNLMPLGGLNGGHVLRFLIEPAMNRGLFEKWFLRYLVVSIVFLIVVFIRMMYADVPWLIEQLWS